MQRATFDCFFLATFEQLFEKLRDTFWKISSNLWKALPHDTKDLVSASFTGLPKAKWGLGNTRARETSEKHERGQGDDGNEDPFSPLPITPFVRAGPPTSFPGFSPTRPTEREKGG